MQVGEIIADNGDDASYSWGFINKNGELVSETKYLWSGQFSEGLAPVFNGEKFGFIDKFGSEIIPLKYESNDSEATMLSLFLDGLAFVSLNGKKGFINKNGKDVIPIKYDEVWCEAFRKKGFIGITLNGKKGFVDIYGNEYFDF